ncbi:MAG: hypothetical protein WC044_12065 [Crocinitomicaceae bacterium]
MNQKLTFVAVVFALLFSLQAMQAIVGAFGRLTLVNASFYIFLLWAILIFANKWIHKK